MYVVDELVRWPPLSIRCAARGTSTKTGELPVEPLQLSPIEEVVTVQRFIRPLPRAQAPHQPVSREISPLESTDEPGGEGMHVSRRIVHTKHTYVGPTSRYGGESTDIPAESDRAFTYVPSSPSSDPLTPYPSSSQAAGGGSHHHHHHHRSHRQAKEKEWERSQESEAPRESNYARSRSTTGPTAARAAPTGAGPAYNQPLA